MTASGPTAAIVLLNYNGKALLEKYIPSFEKAIACSRFSCELWVLDNCSRDGSVEWLKNRFPAVKVFEARENRVLCSYNDFAAEVKRDVLIFMNNDIGVDENFIDPLIEPFTRDETVFFVTPKCFSVADQRYEGNKTKAGVRYGVFWAASIYPGYEKETELLSRSFQGGFGAFDRQKFLQLGGYDDLYLPGRLEDADICFRAQKRGWKVLYAPKSVVYHEGGTSFHKRFGIKKTLVINWRNTFLFMWKNLSDRTNFLSWPLWALPRMGYALLRGQWELPVGFFQALPRFSEARSRRRAAKKSRRMGHSTGRGDI
jgi:GT2 family glycosyltransferase